MIASVLQEAGYKVGLYTSPHLKDFRERIKINGKMIAKKEVVDFVHQYKKEFEQINLSFFEWTVGLAFNYFAIQKVDIAVVETGLGGRLDSTNVVLPELSLITNIGIDHTQFLGHTLLAIAAEKAGIIKQNTPIIIGETQNEIEDLFIERAKKRNAPIYFADKENVTSYKTDLKGVYQEKNSKNCVQAIRILQQKKWNISEENLIRGLLNVVKNTGLLGRWQILATNPLTICDVGHNEAGIKGVVNQLNKITFNKLHFVFGCVNDKSINKILQLLPNKAHYYFCEAEIPRALAVDELYQMAAKYNLKGQKCTAVKEAIKLAKENAKQGDLIFIGGSTFVVAEAI